MSPEALLDTDILSAVMRRRQPAWTRAQAYLGDHQLLSFSIVTRFEILRGLKARQASVQQVTFDRLCAASHVLPLVDAVVIRAADIYADLYRRGTLIGDADILIAATALEHDLCVVTNNEDHFRRVSGLRVENWLA
jgi:tRNA(fMet)-specific endonuclease VapC